MRATFNQESYSQRPDLVGRMRKGGAQVVPTGTQH